MNWGLVLPFASPVVLLVLGAWLKRRQDRQTVDFTAAQTKQAEAQTQGIAADTLIKTVNALDRRVEDLAEELRLERISHTTERSEHERDRAAWFEQKAALSERIEHQEKWALALHTWIKGGAKPPAPDSPPWLLEAIARTTPFHE